MKGKPEVIYRRSHFTVDVIVETAGLPEAEHKKQVYYVGHNLMDNKTPPTIGFVCYIVRDEQGNVVQFSGNGVKASPETQELIDGLLKNVSKS